MSLISDSGLDSYLSGFVHLHVVSFTVRKYWSPSDVLSPEMCVYEQSTCMWIKGSLNDFDQSQWA